MTIYPAIDLHEGQVVRLRQGRLEESTVYSRSPAEQAQRWEELGAQFLHVVDLDGAFAGEPRNLDAVAKICARCSVPVQVGGGIRSLGTIHRYLSLGVRRVILGTAAVCDEEFLHGALERFGPEQIMCSIDAREGVVAVRGWAEATELSAEEAGRRLVEAGVRLVVHTDIARDGVLRGPNVAASAELARKTGLAVIVSGGISSLEHVREVCRAKDAGIEGMIIGRALYEGAVSLSEALAIAAEHDCSE